jgi:protein-S-isoprenylcysteine O-methyltransferase Ste14
MASFIKHENGMNIIGQGSNIVRTTLPFIILAVVINIFLPKIAALPGDQAIYKTIGLILLCLGILLWVTGLVQLLLFFPKGKLVRNGAFMVCRNPVYASYIVLILPAVSFLTVTWVYFVPAVIMYFAFKKFIKKEEQDLIGVFGDEYRDYMKKVPQVMPGFRNI